MQLSDYLKKKKMTQSRLATLIGVSNVQIHWLVHRKRNPSLELARIIESKTDGEVSASELFSSTAPSRLKNRRKKKTIEKTKT